jgi:hypothetical protein
MKNKPWEFCDLWDNESQFLGWLRGQLRQIWSDYPVRTTFKSGACKPVNDAMRIKYGLHKQTKNAGQCVFCAQWFPMSKLEVDHIIGEGTMTSIDHVDSYLDHLMCKPDNMQLTCKPCHKIKTYAERYDLDFEDARLEKAVIEWLKQPLHNQKEILVLAGFSDDEIKNAGGRRKAARKLLTP